MQDRTAAGPHADATRQVAAPIHTV